MRSHVRACQSARTRVASPPSLLVSVYLWLWHSRLIPLCSRRRQKPTSLTCTQVLRGGARAAARRNVLSARTKLSEALEEECGAPLQRAEAANEQELNWESPSRRLRPATSTRSWSWSRICLLSVIWRIGRHFREHLWSTENTAVAIWAAAPFLLF